ncbi:S8 family peptidase [Caldalkalibacillus mannanilyticus]|uniref:S8 family peptidase n=1 Tax=Caldalkalibacillus mannanilyticus TaxID=1418 RepID=UPI0009DE1443|nr:S8 family serine peptidase [Caldalkalibacillus mannanilyticus]
MGNRSTRSSSAWGYQYSGKGVKVAVLDTGIEREHRDLKIAGGVSFITKEGEGNAFLDHHGHGTHIAGIISAQHNGFGVKGVAPDAEVYSVKVIDASGTGYLSDVLAGVDWCITNKMDVINMSFGLDSHSEVLQQILDTAYHSGMVIVAAAGNEGNQRGTGDNVAYPARHDSVIAVAATTDRYVRASYSSTGPAVELAAPGEEVLSTYINGQYAYSSGTSMAAPYVTGIVALLKEARPQWTPERLRSFLHETALDLGTPGVDNRYGHGFVQFVLPPEESKDPPVVEEPVQPPKVVLPSPPSNVQGMAYEGRVELSWNPSPEEHVAGYFIYIDGVRYNQEPVQASHIEVSPLTNGKTYRFTVTAVNTEGDESDPSGGIDLKPMIPVTFHDLSVLHWAYADTIEVGGRGWMTGTAPHIFSPNKGLTRAEAAMILVRALQLEPLAGKNVHFRDVGEKYWARKEIEIVAQHEVMTGKSSDQFAPLDIVTREEMALILYRLFFKDQKGGEELPFVDVQIGHWAYNAIKVTVHHGIFVGNQDGTFAPKETLSRVQMAALLYRVSPYFF